MENDVRTEDMYEYTVRFGEAMIVRHLIEYSSGEHDIVIPAYLGGYPVVEIGGAAFQDQFNITGSVTVPEGVRVIGGGCVFRLPRNSRNQIAENARTNRGQCICLLLRSPVDGCSPRSQLYRRTRILEMLFRN